MKNRKFFGVKRFTAVLLSILMLASVVVLPANAETIDEASLATNEIKFKEVSLGEYHSAAIAEDGSLYTWGQNYYGQLGNGLTGGVSRNRYSPTKIMENVKSINLIGDRSYAITDDNTLYAWGVNQYSYYDPGLLGDGTTTDKFSPTKILENVKSVSLGNSSSAAISADGTLYTWGYNSFGHLGDGTQHDRSNPTKILENVKFVNLGEDHSAAITEDGTLYTWGCNWYGQLGDGTKTNRYSPTKVLYNVKSVSLGENHSAAITEDGSLYTWGSNSYGELGDGTNVGCFLPTKIMDNVKSVYLNESRSYAITDDDTLYGWGNSNNGILGDGTTINKSTPTEILKNVKSFYFYLGDFEGSDKFDYAAITLDGTLYTWGNNWYGNLGNNTTVDSDLPTKVLYNVKSVSLGGYHSAAITEDGSLYTWGHNLYGQLGDGTSQNEYNDIGRNYPEKIKAESTIIPNSLITTKESIELEVDKSYIIEAKYYDENCKIAEIEDGIIWSHGTNVNVEVLSNESGYYAVRVTGKKEGTCDVTAMGTKGRSASTTFNIVPSEANVQYIFKFPDEIGLLPVTDKTIKWENGAYSQTNITAELTIKNIRNSDGSGGYLTIDKINFKLQNLDMFKIDGNSELVIAESSKILAPGESVTFPVKLKQKGIFPKRPNISTEQTGDIIATIEGSKKSGNFTETKKVCINYWDEDLKNKEKDKAEKSIEKAKKEAEKTATSNAENVVKAFEKLDDKIALNAQISQDNWLGQDGSNALEVLIYSEISLASMSKETWLKSSGLSDKVIEKIMNKYLGNWKPQVSTATKELPISAIIQNKKGQRIKCDINCLIYGYIAGNTLNSLSGKADITLTNLTTKETQTFNNNIINKGDVQAFAEGAWNIASAELKSGYKSVWGSNADKLANKILEDSIDSIASKAAEFGLAQPVKIILQKYYEKKLKSKFSSKTFELLTYPSKLAVAHCPVDLYIYDSNNNLVGSIEDDEVTLTGDGLALWTEGDDKYAQLFDDSYSIVYKSTDTGTMTLEIYDQANGLSDIRVCTYENVPLKNGLNYTEYITDEILTSDSNYNLISNDDNIISATSVTYIEKEETDSSNDTDSPTPPDNPKDPTPIGTTGDIDNDSKITSADSLYILRASVKLENFTNNQNKLADVDKDGKITSSDALLVLRHSVGFRENDYIGKVLNE